MAMKASDFAYCVCDDCDVFKMGMGAMRANKKFMTCEGCGKPMRELK